MFALLATVFTILDGEIDLSEPMGCHGAGSQWCSSRGPQYGDYSPSGNPESSMIQYDGQGSGDDFYGTFWHPPHGFTNSRDGDRGGRTGTLAFRYDYRQQ
mmetsp:Transcript_33720/g.89322  ORF Transcript_33720/g.89322 Transcript_33720/m.89322 type:complete len:100 (-) Transcript_33720:249-548(-)|eukprot:CAMPEP_0113700450 /NCGR_PEP_ID=MMETSP0038_2-20120614/23964_1 /TAXON_ID=2898 /ORGANISM="Cryptomonas paramecium" /LENGTH=99 /DNA_ID=CAMNT_0000624109 /DNA_START=9 /DNA_END=308 /DNA_ORIENTATION=+ /assembly_acc=CAM_ASM_000170